jgi:hypothetical protein
VLRNYQGINNSFRDGKQRGELSKIIT